MKMEDSTESWIIRETKDLYGIPEITIQEEFQLFDGRVSDKDFLECISNVDQFYDYYEISDNANRVDKVVYRLRGKASIWWER